MPSPAKPVPTIRIGACSASSIHGQDMDVLSFAASDAVLLAVQAGVVAAPRAISLGPLERLRSGWWALVPPASIIVAIAAIGAASATADGLTWLALVAVPPLAAFALGHAMRGARPLLAVLAAALFAVAWAWKGTLAGDAAAVLLEALSCVTLGALLAAGTPATWLKLGIVALAAADAYLVFSNELQAPNTVLNLAAPPAGLPQLQRALFGSAVIGYGDLFVAGLLGGVLAREARYATQLGVAGLELLLAGAFDVLFLVVGTLPATVPVALALLVREGWRRRRTRVR